MAASDHLNSELFHGTAHWFRPGDVVDPTVPATGRVDHAAAWGTPNKQVAASYSAQKSNMSVQPPLFSPFFAVAPMGSVVPNNPTPGLNRMLSSRGEVLHKNHSVGARGGMRVLGIAGFADSSGRVL